MINLFYQNKLLDDTLLINLSNLDCDKVKTIKNITYGYNNEQLVFINISNASKLIDKNMLVDGLLFPLDNLIKSIERIVNHSLSSYFDNGFIIGKVKQCEQIINTHLHKCIVDIGNNKLLNIVCGASNVKQDLYVVVATNGTILPSGKQILSGSVCNNQSEGMLCSYKELNITSDKKGIIVLPAGSKIGQYYQTVYKNIK